MAEIIPAIMPKKFSDIEWAVARVKDRVKTVQLDIMDGQFVKNKSWPYNEHDQDVYQSILREERGLPFWEEIEYELDLMIAHPADALDELIKLSPRRIVIHIESLEEPERFFETLDPYFKEYIEFGVALNTTTDIQCIIPILPHVQFVQCMGIEKIGYQGNPFDERVLAQITDLRKAYPALTISVDGSVNFETASLLIEAGANRLVIGSALFESTDIDATLLEFKSL